MSRNGLLALVAIVILAFGVAIGFVANEATSKGSETRVEVQDQSNTLGVPLTFAGEFGAPGAPQPLWQNPAFAHYDVQLHSRGDPVVMDNPMQAEHGDTCSGPPNTHFISQNEEGVFVCADHIMTALNASGYGLNVLTPSQVLNCSASCTVQWAISTQRQSLRDWWAVSILPWNDNITLPFPGGIGADLQGFAKNGISISSQGGDGVPTVTIVDNNTDTARYWHCVRWTGTNCAGPSDYIVAGTNQAAARQTFQLTITPGHIKFERLASITAEAIVWVDDDAPVKMLNDYVVEFEHHSYNPTKDNAGVPATWHWSGFTLSPSTPFTLIHVPNAQRVINNGGVGSSGSVTFNAPAPANAYLRFSGICKISTDASGSFAVAPKQVVLDYGHVASYFIPIKQGQQTVNFKFEGDDWYTNWACHAEDFHIWAKGTSPNPTPTPVPPVTPIPTPTLVPTSTPTPIATPPIPTATSTPKPGPTATRTPVSVKKICGLHWGSGLLESYGSLSQQDCANRGN